MRSCSAEDTAGTEQRRRAHGADPVMRSPVIKREVIGAGEQDGGESKGVVTGGLPEVGTVEQSRSSPLPDNQRILNHSVRAGAEPLRARSHVQSPACEEGPALGVGDLSA